MKTLIEKEKKHTDLENLERKLFEYLKMPTNLTRIQTEKKMHKFQGGLMYFLKQRTNSMRIHAEILLQNSVRIPVDKLSTSFIVKRLYIQF